MSLTAQQVRVLLDYNPATGTFKWLVHPRNQIAAGAVAGRTDQRGYRVIKIRRRQYFAHRLAWLHAYGKWPRHFVDHINGKKADNRLVNLREATKALNSQNVKGARSNSKTGLLGACWKAKNKAYQAQIWAAGRKHHLGLYSTPEAAHEAYVAAKRKFHEGNTL